MAVAVAAIVMTGAACRVGESQGSTAMPIEDLAVDAPVRPLLDWIAGHPDDVSIVVRGGGGDLAWNAGQERQLASTFKTIVLAAYARDVASGRLEPMERIPRAGVDIWLIAGTDGGAHDAAMTDLADVDGSVTLDDLAQAMTAFSDNAATDALLDRLGRVAVVETMGVLDLAALATSSAPTAGALMALTDPAFGPSPAERVASYAALDDEGRDARAWTGAARFAADPTASVESVQAALGELTGWQQQIALAQALPWRGSAGEMAELFERAILDERLGRDAAEIMRRHLSWPMQDPTIAERFSAVGAKDGAAAGVLAVAGVARPTTGPNAGHEVIVVVSLSGLDGTTWAALYESEAHHRLALGLAEDPALVASLRKMLDP